MKEKIEIFCAQKNNFDYELLDTGGGEKLERVGKYIFARPYEAAVWPKTLKEEWQKVNGRFVTSKKGEKAGWKTNAKIEPRWPIAWNGIRFMVGPTPFRHFGFFPEQASHWEFIEERIAQRMQENSLALLHPTGGTFRRQNSPASAGHAGSAVGKIKFLNLFGYTGVASLFALRAGAEVTHLDASKQSLTLVKENQKLSGMENLPMRIICDDALKFIEREIKRGNKYDAIIMDPPKFGRGPKGEVWKIEEMLPKLLAGISQILSDDPIFVILTSYATDASALSLGYALREALSKREGKVTSGELCIMEKTQGRLISLANTAVWQK